MTDAAGTSLSTARLVLASSSPQRQRLLAQAGVAFEVIAPPLAEPDEHIRHLPPAHQAEASAYFKARSVADRHAGTVVLGADTIVTVHGRVLGKPHDPEDAAEMLRTLSGSRHAVITGVALVGPGSSRRLASETTHVTMREMSQNEIAAYVASREWVDKAGGYAIQKTADRFVRSVEGSFTNVVGLPMELVGRMLGGLPGTRQKTDSSS